jgi:hypothetical protein
MSVFDVGQELHSFIDGILRQEGIDLVVCSERKATAIMRALIEDPDHPLPWGWDKILSSLAVEQFDWLSFTGSKILMFDELAHHGRTLRDRITTLETAIPNARRRDLEIKTVSFAVWEGCTYRPDYAYYPSVDMETYEAIRESIVIMLQDHGSLLLDTEHIELSVRLECGMREFYDTLARISEYGNSYSFISGGQRLNLTIGNPDIVDHEAMGKCLPRGSNIDDVVRKVRVVEKSNERFSILPILYPNIRCEFDDRWVANLPDFLDKPYLKQAPPRVLFYHASLLAGIELLRGVASILTALTGRGTVLEIPRENFQHLSTLFPRVNVDGLWEYVSHVVSEGQLIKPERGKRSSRALRVEESKLLGLCWYVMRRLVSEYDDIPSEGVSWRRLMEIAAEENERVGVAPECLTVVPDRLIDNSLLVTGVREARSSSGDLYVTRTFSSEGEVVSDRIRQQMMVRNPECLTAI